MKLKMMLSVLAVVLLAACSREEDPFVDRVQSPVLVLFENTLGDGGGLTTEPTVTSKLSGAATLSLRILELDKTALLDYKKGIDSLPVSSLPLKVTTRTGADVATLTTDGQGRAVLTRPWSDLGLTAPASGASVSLTVTGTHRGQAFARLVRLRAVN